MSYPPRHPMSIPGMPPMPPGMVPPAYAFSPIAPMMPMSLMTGPILPPGIQMSQVDVRSMAVNNRVSQIQRRPITLRRTYEDQKRQGPGNSGPTITVFVGNITERAADNLVKQLLQKCGTVVSWKRVQGASGKLQAFGFCEYGDPESALRAIRLLHEWEVGDKKLVVKVDAKTKAQLDEYKANKRKSRIDLMDGAGGKTPTESERDDEEELDEDTKKEDSIVRTGIQVLLRDHEYDLSRPVLPPEHRKRSTKNSDGKSAGTEDGEDKEQKDNLDEMDLEEEKKTLIHREIDKFRDTMKKQEEEKEKERERRERDRERRDRGSSRQSSLNSSNRLHSRSTPDRSGGGGGGEKPGYDRSRSRSRDREREREREREERSREREREREERSRERENLNLERAREKEYDRDKREKDKEREREEEEEAYERRKLERKLREKEAAYQERLRNWETRERKKSREYDKYREKEEERRQDETKEAKRLKEFLEDYDDERDDPKYYKGSMLTRRLKEREKEIEMDNRDRQREKEELDEIRQKLMEEGHPDPNAELERIRKETEEKFKPLIKVVTAAPPKPEVKMKPTLMQVSAKVAAAAGDDVVVVVPKVTTKPVVQLDDDPSTQNSLSGLSDITTPKEDVGKERSKPQTFAGLKLTSSNNSEAPEAAASVATTALTPKEENKPKFLGFSGLKLGSSPTHHHGAAPGGTVASGATAIPATSAAPATAAAVVTTTTAASKRKKLIVSDVFNTDEDENAEGNVRKRKLVPLDYSEDEKKAVSGSSGSNQEEKRKHIKNLIDKIPTEKEKLFAYDIDWTIVDGVLMERRIRPWINKKIVEYIGEEEPTLVDFICSKLMAGSTPQSILDDVQMVLDDEAEVFIVKMWRLLIYEIEAKKLGLVK